jgi:hypothetical protein
MQGTVRVEWLFSQDIRFLFFKIFPRRDATLIFLFGTFQEVPEGNLKNSVGSGIIRGLIRRNWTIRKQNKKIRTRRSGSLFRSGCRTWMWMQRASQE